MYMHHFQFRASPFYGQSWSDAPGVPHVLTDRRYTRQCLAIGGDGLGRCYTDTRIRHDTSRVARAVAEQNDAITLWRGSAAAACHWVALGVVAAILSVGVATGRIQVPTRSSANQAFVAADPVCTLSAARRSGPAAEVLPARSVRSVLGVPALAIAAVAEQPRAAGIPAGFLLRATRSRILVETDGEEVRAALAACGLLRAVLLLRAAGTVVRADLRAERARSLLAAAHHPEGERLPIRRAAFERRVIAADWLGAAIRRRAAGTGAGTDVAATVALGAANLPLVVAAELASGADGIAAARLRRLRFLFLLLPPPPGQCLVRPLVAEERGEHTSPGGGNKAAARGGA